MAISGYHKLHGVRRNGGIRTLALIDPVGLVKVSYDPEVHDYSEIQLVSGSRFIKYEFREDEAQYREEVTVTQGATAVTHELTFLLDKMTNTASGAVSELLRSSYNGMIAIIRTHSDDCFLIGYSPEFGKERPLRVASVNAATGKRFSEPGGEVVTLRSVDCSKAKTFSCSFDALL